MNRIDKINTVAGLDDGIPLGFYAANQVTTDIGIRGGAVCHRSATQAPFFILHSSFCIPPVRSGREAHC
jgi:hypothetical protein